MHGATIEIHFNICREIGVKLENAGWDYHTPKLIDTSPEHKVTVLDGINKWKPTQPALTIYWAS
jgi:hypothetical protein